MFNTKHYSTSQVAHTGVNVCIHDVHYMMYESLTETIPAIQVWVLSMYWVLLKNVRYYMDHSTSQVVQE